MSLTTGRDALTCDRCGKTEREPYRGWFEITRPTISISTMADYWQVDRHFCSAECVIVKLAQRPKNEELRHDEFAKRVRALVDLQPNWDSYGGRPITTRVIITAERLHALLHDCQPDPIPMSHGGIALEWRHGRARLELEIDPDGNVIVQDFEIKEA